LRITAAAVRSYARNWSIASLRTPRVATNTSPALLGGWRQGTWPAIDASQFRPSNGLMVSREGSTPSRQRTLTSILSGSERGT
jgi:hypothetical protein